METLNTLTLPLNCSSLIEASAGTGKTYTIQNLYLRLILGISHNEEKLTPLSVTQILVVTFTNAATEELKDRIRKNIKECYRFFQKKREDQDYVASAKEAFFQDLFDRVENVDESLLRLRIAEREIDIASVFTINSFCQKMLHQFAFDSGMPFEMTLNPSEERLLLQLAQDVWREQFYPMPLEETEWVVSTLKTPEDALGEIRNYLTEALPELSDEQQMFKSDLATHLAKQKQFIADVKQYWLAHQEEIANLIEEGKKSFQKNTYNNRNKWINAINAWVKSTELSFPTHFDRFCQDTINEKTAEDATPLTHAHFAKNQAFLTAYQQQFENKQKSLLLYHFLLAMREKLATYKATHTEMSFNDVLLMLHQALKGARGDVLASQIRHLFPFAMIDEFQDTDLIQYEIFNQIFMEGENANRGFIMIGDPKQSIYKFRGADIFTYLKAASQAKIKRTLDKNWRSLPPLIESVNQLFAFPQESKNSPFLYHDIQFQAVSAKDTNQKLKGEANVNCYLQPTFNRELAAEHCAAKIQKQLTAISQGKFSLDNAAPFAEKDIAVLVRDRDEAILIKNALAERGIRSVYLSEKRSVYHSQTALELSFLLKACLSPTHKRSLLNALGTALWGLTAKEIAQLQNEKTWDSYVERFTHYHQIWKKQGVSPMLYQLFLQEGIIERLKGKSNADRQLTDLFHLTELLQSATQEVENETALVRWYEQNLDHEEQNDDYILRLESEEALIKIVTIHGSKGLQYPIVWLPFVGKPSRNLKSSKNKPELSVYRNAQSEKHWHFGLPTEEIIQAADQAEFAEDLRLLYVALTRAESQINLILPQTFEKGWNGMHYLLSNGEIGLKGAENSPETKTYFANKGIDCHLEELDETAPIEQYQPLALAEQNRQALTFDATICRHNGQITSFTGLYQYHERANQMRNKGYLSYFSPDNAQRDYSRDDDTAYTAFTQDTSNTPDLTPFTESEGKTTAEENITPYYFPHSAKVGNILHGLLENFDFQQAVKNEDLIAICEALNLDQEKWEMPLQQWFEHIRTTPFSPNNFALCDIPPQFRLDEWQFLLRLKNETALKKLNETLKEHSTLAKSLPDLTLPQLEGYVRGFVDCIIKVQDQFYIIDYKSNFLGYFPQDYRPAKLEKVIGQYRYDLQYLLYTLALHRYLQHRLGEKYDYERDFGGVAYLFLRAMNGEPNSGVYFDKPSRIFIEKLDQLFDSEA